MNIGANIRRLREGAKLSQTELAHKIGVAPSFLCQLERGTKVPSLPLSVELASALDCTLQDIAEGT